MAKAASWGLGCAKKGTCGLPGVLGSGSRGTRGLPGACYQSQQSDRRLSGGRAKMLGGPMQRGRMSCPGGREGEESIGALPLCHPRIPNFG